MGVSGWRAGHGGGAGTLGLRVDIHPAVSKGSCSPPSMDGSPRQAFPWLRSPPWPGFWVGGNVLAGSIHPPSPEGVRRVPFSRVRLGRSGMCPPHVASPHKAHGGPRWPRDVSSQGRSFA